VLDGLDDDDEDKHWDCSDNRRFVGFVKSHGVITYILTLVCERDGRENLPQLFSNTSLLLSWSNSDGK
jgi:hypothetical protein